MCGFLCAGENSRLVQCLIGKVFKSIQCPELAPDAGASKTPG